MTRPLFIIILLRIRKGDILKVRWLQAIIAVLFSNIVIAMDNPHFYKASQFFYEPRIAKDYLGTASLLFNGGKANTGLNGCGQKVPLLSICGMQTLKNIAQGVPNKVFDQVSEDILNNLWQDTTTRSSFGQLCVDGRFRIMSADLFLTQNGAHGFFAELHIPIRKITLSHIDFIDHSSDDDAGTSVNLKQWSAFIEDFASMMKRYDIHAGHVEEDGLGDISLKAGWALNYDETEKIDFIDFTIMSGLLLPTSKKQNPSIPFAFPLGYNGHFAIPLDIRFGLGLYDWFTLGSYGTMLIFFPTQRIAAMKTAREQRGFIKLAHGCATEDRGPLITIGTYAKADHVACGFSCLIGYQYNNQTKTTLFPFEDIFDEKIVNTDPCLRGWSMHTINIIAEYDFADECCSYGPRLALSLDVPIAGKRIFLTKIGGFNIALDWEF